MSPMEADCWDLTLHGWGSHSRDEIPADWETHKGPDEIPHHTKSNRGRPTAETLARRKLVRQRIEETVTKLLAEKIDDVMPQRTKNGRGLPLAKWQHRRALYLEGKRRQNPGVSGPTVGARPTVRA